MENYDNFYNDGLEAEKEEPKEEKKPFDPVFAIIVMQISVVIALLIALMVIKNIFPKEGAKIKEFYREKVMAETNVELVLEENSQSNG